MISYATGTLCALSIEMAKAVLVIRVLHWVRFLSALSSSGSSFEFFSEVVDAVVKEDGIPPGRTLRRGRY